MLKLVKQAIKPHRQVSDVDILEAASLSTGPLLFLAFNEDHDGDFDYWVPELQLAAPYLTGPEAMMLFIEGRLTIKCLTVDRMETMFAQTVGDFGPTPLNNYEGNARIYACTVANGEAIEENS